MPGPLHDIRVLDLATVIAGPGAARYLADFGADVLKVERPQVGDSTRTMGLPDPRDGTSVYWKLVGRNKRCATLDLKSDEGRDALLRLVDHAHVLIENFRPGVMERLGLGPDVLLGRNPALVMCRVTAFGQDGPYAQRPGFATLAEALSGFAAINGEADRGPLLPPVALTDEVTALAAAFAVMVALHSGVGQVVDVALLESLLQCMGPLLPAYGLTGFLQQRAGSSLPYSVPRGTWRCRDGRWVAVSASAETVGRRVMELVGLGDRADLRSFTGRIAARDEVDAAIEAFCRGRTADEVVAAFDAVHAAAAPVKDMAEVFADPQLAARGAIVEVDGIPMQGLVARLSRTPGAVRWAGRPLGADDPPGWASTTADRPARWASGDGHAAPRAGRGEPTGTARGPEGHGHGPGPARTVPGDAGGVRTPDGRPPGRRSGP
ncbi:MAG TPA: CoA transferase [Acidimicrobiales bacterium]|nr:CoA transferase [Acidimicrobiales bacterium]